MSTVKSSANISIKIGVFSISPDFNNYNMWLSFCINLHMASMHLETSFGLEMLNSKRFFKLLMVSNATNLSISYFSLAKFPKIQTVPMHNSNFSEGTSLIATNSFKFALKYLIKVSCLSKFTNLLLYVIKAKILNAFGYTQEGRLLYAHNSK